MNKFQIIGRLGGNPRRYAERAVSISLASSRRFKRDNERVEVTDWNDVVLFDKLAQIAVDYLQKGDSVYVEGQVRRNRYNRDGRDVYSTDLIARNIEFLNVRGKGAASGGNGSGYNGGAASGNPDNGTGASHTALDKSVSDADIPL